MADKKGRLMLTLLFDLMAAPSIKSRSAVELIRLSHSMEMQAICELLPPHDRDVIAKERSSHWTSMLFSSRIYFDASLRELFRMDSGSMAALVAAVCPHFVQYREAPDAISPPKRLAVFLFLCAQGASVRVTADRFAIGPSTVSGIVKEAAEVVCRVLQGLVAFPPFRLCASHFTNECGIPQIVGCIDVSHIPICKPSENGAMYFNRKCWYSIVLQAVVDWRGRFCDLDCKWPGRVGDSRVFRNSTMGQAFPALSATSNTVAIPTGTGTYADIPYYLLGDSGYQNTNSMVTTFEIAETQDPICDVLNKRLCHARYCVECSFGQLKCRWRVLLRGIQQHISVAPDMVFALCIIQNFLMDHNDKFAFSEDEKKRILESYQTAFPQPELEVEASTSENIRLKLKQWYEFRQERDARG